MKLIRESGFYVQKRDIAFLVNESPDVFVGESIEEVRQSLYDCMCRIIPEADKNTFVLIRENRENKLAEFLRRQKWLLDLDLLLDWNRSEIEQLLEQKKRELAVLCNQAQIDDVFTLSRSELSTIDMRTSFQTIEELEDFFEAHRWRPFRRWPDQLTWALPS